MRLIALFVCLFALLPGRPSVAVPGKPPALRVATFNASLYSDEAGGLLARLQADDAAARKIAAVIQKQRPNILLLNEFDYDYEGKAADLFQKKYLGVAQFQQQPIQYRYRYFAPVNTGLPSGFDLDNDGMVGGGNDAFGFGRHPGQYGMLVLSQYPIEKMNVRTFQKFLWKDMPGALIPANPDGTAWYSTQAWNAFRLSSKSHWDIPVNTPLGRLHLLASHPTPPVFDGAEDRNGRRNHDEIRFWREYIGGHGKQWIVDDDGMQGGLEAGARFIIAGDLNADPADGDGLPGTIAELLENPRVLRMPTPASDGAEQAALADAGANLKHRGAHRHDTGNFGPRVGNMRLDYVLPSTGLKVTGSGVFWPKTGEPGADWLDASDHRMVWVDLQAF